jgi:hypothetical protein
MSDFALFDEGTPVISACLKMQCMEGSNPKRRKLKRFQPRELICTPGIIYIRLLLLVSRPFSQIEGINRELTSEGLLPSRAMCEA